MEKKDARILVVDDNYDVLQSAMVLLKRFYTDVQIEQVPENIVQRIGKDSYDLILLDMNFRKGKRDGEEGFHWLERILESDREAVVVMITAYGAIDLADRAVRAGAGIRRGACPSRSRATGRSGDRLLFRPRGDQ